MSNQDIVNTEIDNISKETGFPVQISFIELAKMYTNKVPWQWHPEIEIIIVNHGTIRFMTNDHQEVLNSGQGVIINANIMHSIEPATLDSNCSMYSASFNPSYLFNNSDTLLAQKYLLPVINSKTFQTMRLDEENSEESKLLNFVNSIIADNLLHRFGYELTIKAKLCDFWLSLMNMINPTQNATKIPKGIGVDEERTKEIISYMEEHYSEKITLENLADAVHLSRSECCRCFKRALNTTPIEHLMKLRILKAATLIQNNDEKAKSFSDLAFHVGFNNASYFNKVFREYLNCTPSEYRRKVKNDPNFDPFKNKIL